MEHNNDSVQVDQANTEHAQLPTEGVQVDTIEHVEIHVNEHPSWRKTRKNKTYNMVLLAMLTALVIVLQLWGSAIQIGGTSLSLVLIPIVIGGLVLGVKGGTFLGLVFGVFVFLWCGVLGYDAFTAFLFQNAPVITALTCIVKGTVAGLVPPLVHKALSRKWPLVSTVIASASAPICNTGVFLLGMSTILGTLESYLSGIMTVGYFITAIILVNFTVELVVNLIAAPAIFRVLHAVKRKKLH